MLQELSKMYGFELQLLPVAAPGVEQKSTWLQIRQSRPDFVFRWGWGVMNSTALKEAVATGYPRDKMYGVWWAGAEPDVKDVGEGAKGYNALALNPSGQSPKVIQDILKYWPRSTKRARAPGRRSRSGRCCTCAACFRRCSASRASSARRSASARARS